MEPLLPLAQLGSASALGAEGRRFESCMVDHDIYRERKQGSGNYSTLSVIYTFGYSVFPPPHCIHIWSVARVDEWSGPENRRVWVVPAPWVRIPHAPPTHGELGLNTHLYLIESDLSPCLDSPPCRLSSAGRAGDL